MALYLIQECCGRVCLHFEAALRAGHWGWHIAGIGREIKCIWPRTHRASATRTEALDCSLVDSPVGGGPGLKDFFHDGR